MVSSVTKKAAKKLGLQAKSGRCYGVYQGYWLTLTDGYGIKTLQIGASFPDEGVKTAAQAELFNRDEVKEYKLRDFSFSDMIITINFVDTFGTPKRIISFCEWFVPRLHALGVLGQSTCPMCGQTLSGGQGVFVNGAAIAAHDSCINKYEQELSDKHEEEMRQPSNVLGGAIGATLGGVLGSIPWIVAYYFGWFVGIFGILIPLGAKKGYELLRGRKGKVKLLIVLLVTIVCFFGTYYVAIAASIYMELQNMGVPFVLNDVFVLIGYIFADSSSYIDLLPDLLIGLVFAGIGIASVLPEIGREGRKEKVLRFNISSQDMA